MIKFLSIIVLLSFVFVFTGCNSCSSQVVRRQSSPDGLWLAEVVVGECGATTDFDTSVRISRTTGVSDTYVDNTVFKVKSFNSSIDVSWNDNEILLVTGTVLSEYIYSKKNSYQNLNIRYDLKDDVELRGYISSDSEYIDGFDNEHSNEIDSLLRHIQEKNE